MCVCVCLCPAMHFHSFTPIDSKTSPYIGANLTHRVEGLANIATTPSPLFSKVNLQKMHRVSIVNIYIYIYIYTNFNVYIYIYVPCAHILEKNAEYSHAFSLFQLCSCYLKHAIIKLQGVHQKCMH